MANGRDYSGKRDLWRNGGSAKTSTKHPYGAFEHRVTDSPAYADLSFSARAMLVLVIRQLTRDNNGRLVATFSYMRKYGFESEHTISRCIKELIAHGMIYRTRSGGYQQGAAQYAVTWLSIKNREGLFLDRFKPCAWRDWQPGNKKSPSPKMQGSNCKNGMWTASATAQNAVGTAPKSADTVLVPVGGELSTSASAVSDLEVDPAFPASKCGKADPLPEKAAAHKVAGNPAPTICQHAGCRTLTLKRDFCAKHRHPASAHAAAQRYIEARGT